MKTIDDTKQLRDLAHFFAGVRVQAIDDGLYGSRTSYHLRTTIEGDPETSPNWQLRIDLFHQERRLMFGTIGIQLEVISAAGIPKTRDTTIHHGMIMVDKLQPGEWIGFVPGPFWAAQASQFDNNSDRE